MANWNWLVVDIKHHLFQLQKKILKLCQMMELTYLNLKDFRVSFYSTERVT